jgi:mannose/cellobiose epimerase-like protein (N-acyl-D-glucosamine 2-epimerase family)
VKEQWREEQRVNLITFGSKGYHEGMGGFGRLQADGTILESRGLETWANCRAVYCFTLDVLAGNEVSREWVDAAANCLLDTLYDPENGGWFTGVDSTGVPHDDGRKEAYTHAFVLLAASSLTAVGSPRAAEMLSLVDSTITNYFWSEDERATTESWDRTWSVPEPYRGANSNMHMTEASLAAFDVTGHEKWLHRANDIVARIVGEYAQSMDWRIPEHFDADWVIDREYNVNEPHHPFRPYGATPGHGFEWSRLVLQLSRGLRNNDLPVPAWHTDAALGLFRQAAQDGWEREGHPGFCYTVDFDGTVVSSLHLAWVTCEALSAAIVLERDLGGQEFKDWVERLWDYCAMYLVDEEYGGWRTELNSKNQPSTTIWGDKPDFYHPLQSVLIPGTKPGPSLLRAFPART